MPRVSTAMPSYRFSYYDTTPNPNWQDNGNWPYLKWNTIRDTPFISLPQDDFGYYYLLDNKGNNQGGWRWSLKEITYPEGGKNLIEYESDSFHDTTVFYHWYYYSFDVATGGFIEQYKADRSGQFASESQGGGRVRSIKKFDGINNESPVIIQYDYRIPNTEEDSSGHYSGIPETWFRKHSDYRQKPICSSGERGQAEIYYEFIQKTIKDSRTNKSNGSTKTTYHIPDSEEKDKPILYVAVHPDYYNGNFTPYSNMALLQTNTLWQWGIVEKVEHFSANNVNTAIKEKNYTYPPFDTGEISAVATPERLGGNNSVSLYFPYRQLS